MGDLIPNFWVSKRILYAFKGLSDACKSLCTVSWLNYNSNIFSKYQTFDFCTIVIPFLKNNEITNSINEVTIILGPDGVFNSKEQNKPITTDNMPPIIEIIIIWIGLELKFLDMAGGINSKPVINKTPIILIDIAIIPANITVKI